MTDVAYWKARCESAEAALKRARIAVVMSAPRRAVLRVLAEAKSSEALTTDEVVRLVEPILHQPPSRNRLLTVLNALKDYGLVEKIGMVGKRPGAQATWRLGHMVQVAE